MHLRGEMGKVLRRPDYDRRKPNATATKARATVVKIEHGLNDASLTDVPDLPARPLDELRQRVAEAARRRDTGQYQQAGEDADRVLIELQIHVVSGARREAAELVTHAAYNAFVVATTTGCLHLAQQAARRAYEAAMIADRRELDAFAMFAQAPAIARTGDPDWAMELLDRALVDVDSANLAAIRHGDTVGAEMHGLLHLMRAHLAARDGDAADAHAHLDEAAGIAARTGERDAFRQHFGPTNVRVWRAAIGTELGEGAAVGDRLRHEPIDVDLLESPDRAAALHLDLARAYGQAEGDRDVEAMRHLDAADRFAPQRIRQDPAAQELMTALSHRAKRRVYEMDGLRHRLGGAPGAPGVVGG
jgi:hypothetical protein